MQYTAFCICQNTKHPFSQPRSQHIHRILKHKKHKIQTSIIYLQFTKYLRVSTVYRCRRKTKYKSLTAIFIANLFNYCVLSETIIVICITSLGILVRWTYRWCILWVTTLERLGIPVLRIYWWVILWMTMLERIGVPVLQTYWWVVFWLIFLKCLSVRVLWICRWVIFRMTMVERLGVLVLWVYRWAILWVNVLAFWLWVAS